MCMSSFYVALFYILTLYNRVRNAGMVYISTSSSFSSEEIIFLLLFYVFSFTAFSPRSVSRLSIGNFELASRHRDMASEALCELSI
ncbi:hypothetical protein V1508DRAFT_218669 [Lipomyces doorenjongii]|uniref:uncharacterized protein n=1 Tax=Lipomyces doorenjongii TaxID=383834 RepID=UPI0034CD9DD9